jgi:hypothetical protein
MKKIILRQLIKEEILLLKEGIEHIQNLYKSWATKKSGNFDGAMKIMNDVIKYKQSLPKKDFSKYESYEELKSDLDGVLKKQKSKDITKFYEDNDLLVIVANTWEASCKYGASSKWCTTSKDTDSYWKRHNDLGTEYFWIFKNFSPENPNYKYSFHIKDNKNKIKGGGYEFDICNSINKCGNENSELFKSSLIIKHPKFNEILSKLVKHHETRYDEKLEQEKRKNIYRFWVKQNYDKLFEMLYNDIIKNELSLELEEKIGDLEYIIDDIEYTLEDYGYELVGDIPHDLIKTIYGNVFGEVNKDVVYDNFYKEIIYIISEYIQRGVNGNKITNDDSTWVDYIKSLYKYLKDEFSEFTIEYISELEGMFFGELIDELLSEGIIENSDY